MKSWAKVLLCVCFLISGCDQSKPQYAWKQFYKGTFALQAASGQYIILPQSTAKLHVVLQADSAVLAGELPKSVFDSNQSRRVVPSDRYVSAMPCHFSMTLQGETSCKADDSQQMVYIVFDERGLGTVGLGFWGLLFKSSHLVERATNPNKVTITLSSWTCIQNCPVSSATNPSAVQP